MNKTRFWVTNVSCQTLSWEGKFTHNPKLRDVLVALKQENLRERYAALIDLVEYTITITPGHSAAPASSLVLELAGARLGTIVSQSVNMYNNDPEHLETR